MPLRSILLRVLFWSLALSAVFGAGGILLASHDALWHVAATSITTAGAALLLLFASAKMDKPVSRPASLLAVTLVVIEYLLTLAAIWNLDALLGTTGQYVSSLWLTILFLSLVGIPAILLLRMTSTPLTAVAGRVGLALAAEELALLLVVAWQPTWRQFRDASVLAGWLVPFSLLMILCLIGQGVPPRRYWRWLGVAAAAVGYALNGCTGDPLALVNPDLAGASNGGQSGKANGNATGPAGSPSANPSVGQKAGSPVGDALGDQGMVGDPIAVLNMTAPASGTSKPSPMAQTFGFNANVTSNSYMSCGEVPQPGTAAGAWNYAEKLFNLP